MSKIEVQLTNEQLVNFRRHKTRRNLANTLLRKVIDELLDSLAEAEDNFWTQAYELTGTGPETHRLEIQYITGKIIATPIEEDKK